MPGQILGRARRSASREIRGTGADHAVKSADPDRNHATVRQRADAEPDIDLLLKETQHAIVEDQTDIDIRIGLQEIPQDRDEANAPEDDWGCDDQLAGRRGIFAGADERAFAEGTAGEPRSGLLRAASGGVD